MEKFDKVTAKDYLRRVYSSFMTFVRRMQKKILNLNALKTCLKHMTNKLNTN